MLQQKPTKERWVYWFEDHHAKHTKPQSCCDTKSMAVD